MLTAVGRNGFLLELGSTFEVQRRRAPPSFDYKAIPFFQQPQDFLAQPSQVVGFSVPILAILGVVFMLLCICLGRADKLAKVP